jgi:hypothetical protein
VKQIHNQSIFVVFGQLARCHDSVRFCDRQGGLDVRPGDPPKLALAGALRMGDVSEALKIDELAGRQQTIRPPEL